MRHRPFICKRRPKRADLWGLEVTSDIQPTSLSPSGGAKHEVRLQNIDTMAYGLTVQGVCGPQLRYESAARQICGPLERKLNPGDEAPLKGKLSRTEGNSSGSEQVELQAVATPSNPEILAQKASIVHNLDLTE